jgi:hypothetical protein
MTLELRASLVLQSPGPAILRNEKRGSSPRFRKQM